MAGPSVRPMPVAWMTDVGWAEDIASWRTAMHDSAVDASTNPFTEEAELLALEVASRRRAAPNISCRASADGTSGLAVTHAETLGPGVVTGVVADPDAAPQSAASRSKAVRSPRRTYLSKPAGSRSSAIAAAIDAGPASRAAERQADASEAAGIIRAMQQHARMMAAQSRVKYRAAPMLHTTHLVHEAEDGHWQSQKVGPVIERERREEQARRVPTLDAWMARQWQRRPKLERKLNSSVGVSVREIISVSTIVHRHRTRMRP